MNQSDSIIEIAKALNAFQGKLTSVKKDSINPFFHSRYASLDTIWDTIRKPLSENGLSVTQTMDTYVGDKPISLLETTLYHTSGEWVSGRMILNPEKDTPQGLGSSISYARRYSLSAILGIVADEDDDAESTKEKKVEKTKPVAGQASSKPDKGQESKTGTKKKFDTTTLTGALDFLENKYPVVWGHSAVATKMANAYGVEVGTTTEMIAQLNPEQTEKFATIVSNEVIKANG